MTRISEKVRDIVEVRPYTKVDDLLRDPESTLSNYHFTDVTADLMGRWLDSVGSDLPEQACRAIAGFRGVGKSHFLAAFAILMSHPELRSRVADSHVLSSSQRLLRRHYPVVNVRRGLGHSLLEELVTAVGLTFHLSQEKVGSTIRQVVDTIVANAGGLTPILIFDSAPERTAPVDRNDGEILGEIAFACKSASVFVGLALDDDIAMADGSNSAVSQTYIIEYLDPEHLYKIVNTHIFPKNPRTQSVLGSLYEDFRSAIPDFRWSEQRFSSLYPLHPLLLELAPFIRSYLPTFALFGFASSAGEKIMGRPADSLIGVDDVFDAIEFELRKVKDLKCAFEVFDTAAKQIGNEMPVVARHKAKLVLKVLFLNSLSLRGLSGSEIAAAMMITDDGEPGSSARDISAIVSAYAAAYPSAISVEHVENGPIRYKFNVGSDEFSEALDLVVRPVDPSMAEPAFYSAVAERFPELTDLAENTSRAVELFAVWRGSRRPGRIVVGPGYEPPGSRLDWEVFLDLFGECSQNLHSPPAAIRIEWKVGCLTEEERRSLLVDSVLSADKELHNKYSEQASAAALSAANAVRTAVERVMITDAKLVIDGFDYNFSQTALETDRVADKIGAMLEPLFETLYPEHPYFVETLDSNIVERFVKNLSDGEHSAVDHAALTFGVPLGVVEFDANGYSVLRKENLQQTPFVASILELVSAEGESGQIGLNVAESRLGDPPVALTSEATRLVLSAMALRGLVELVTSDNDRIGGRSIDLKLDWSRIAFVSAPQASKLSNEKLLEWARLITGESEIASLTESTDRSKVLEAFVEISAQWERRNPFEEFEQIPDCEFNTNIWRHSNRTWDAYSAMVANVNETLEGNISIDECLERICNNFMSRPELFYESRRSVTAIEDFVRSYPDYSRIARYLALADMTGNQDVEAARERLRDLLQKASVQITSHDHREVGYGWEKFLRLYTEHYVNLHGTLSRTNDFRLFAEKALRKGDLSVLSEEAGLSRKRQIREVKRKYAALKCDLDPAPFLQLRPYCDCGFRVSDATVLEELADDLRNLSDAVHASRYDQAMVIPVKNAGTEHRSSR